MTFLIFDTLLRVKNFLAKILNIMERRVSLSAEGGIPQTPVYKGTLIPEQVRNALPALYIELLKENIGGVEIISAFQRVYPELNGKTFYRWLARFKSHGYAITPEKNSGRPAALTEEEVDLCVGYVLVKNEQGERDTVKNVLGFIKEAFGSSLDGRTIMTHLERCGISKRNTGVKGDEFGTLQERHAAYVDFIKWFRSHIWPKLLKGTIMCSLDVTYTSHRNEQDTTLAGKGNKTPTNRLASRFTNCIVTALLSDGTQLPSLMFTYNTKFKTNGKQTKRKVEDIRYFRQLLDEYKIREDRVIFIPPPKGTSKGFMRENNDVLLQFLNHHKDALQKYRSVIFFTDGGAARKQGGDPLVEKNGFGQHVFYP